MNYVDKIQTFNKLDSMNPTKTSLFLIPLLEFNYADLKSWGFVNAFLGREISDFGTEIVLLFDNTQLSEKARKQLTSHPEFKETDDFVDQSTAYSYTMFCYNIKSDTKEKIIKPFILGNYSHMDSEFIKKYFNPLIKGLNGEVFESVNYQILTRSKKRKEMLEESLCAKIEDGAELYSKPLVETECFYGVYEPTEEDKRILELLK